MKQVFSRCPSKPGKCYCLKCTHKSSCSAVTDLDLDLDPKLRRCDSAGVLLSYQWKVKTIHHCEKTFMKWQKVTFSCYLSLQIAWFVGTWDALVAHLVLANWKRKNSPEVRVLSIDFCCVIHACHLYHKLWSVLQYQKPQWHLRIFAYNLRCSLCHICRNLCLFHIQAGEHFDGLISWKWLI